MENGIANASILVVTITQDENTFTMNKTWQEIYDCYQNGGYAYGRLYNTEFPETLMMLYSILQLYENDGEYAVNVMDSYYESNYFTTSSPDGFPIFAGGEPG